MTLHHLMLFVHLAGVIVWVGGMSFAPVIFTHSTPTWLRNWMNSSDWSCRSSQSFMPELPSKMSAISARTPGARGIEINAQLRQPWGMSAVQDTGPHGV